MFVLASLHSVAQNTIHCPSNRWHLYQTCWCTRSCRQVTFWFTTARYIQLIN